MKVLILAVVKNRRWADLDCFALSIVQSGFQGDKAIFHEDVPQDAIDNLNTLGFQTIPIRQYNHLHFQTFRYFPALDFLRSHYQKYRFVYWLDTSDLVFQSDPTPFMEDITPSFRLIAAKEGRLIRNEGINSEWLKRMHLPADELAYHLDQEILCSGTIQGCADTVLQLFEKMVEKTSTTDDMMGEDQGIYNYIIRKHFWPVAYVPEMSEGFITTCGMFLSKGEGNGPHFWTVEPPYFDRDTGLVMTNDQSKPFCIAHQYNRNYGIFDPNGDWRGHVERRYRNKA